MSSSLGRGEADESQAVPQRGRGREGRGAVVDSSALLCLLNGEVGAERVAEALPSAAIGAVNLAEVVTKLRERGLSAEEVDEVLGGLHLDIRPFTTAQAAATGHLRAATRSLGLSLGDRACLALAAELDTRVLTADRGWADAGTGVEIDLIR